MGLLYKQNHQYKEAIKEFKKAKAHFIHDKKSYMYNKSSREINSSIYAMRHENEITKMDISLAHGNINGKNAEFAGFEDNGPHSTLQL